MKNRDIRSKKILLIFLFYMDFCKKRHFFAKIDMIIDKLKKIYKININQICMILNKNGLFGKFLLKIMQQEAIIRHCGAGITKISICANGDVYPCDSFVGNSSFCLGNITSGVDNKKFGETINIYNSSCEKCWARLLCGGDCYHNLLITKGKINEVVDYYCDLYKTLIEIAIDLISFISELDNNTKNFILKGVAIKNENA